MKRKLLCGLLTALLLAGCASVSDNMPTSVPTTEPTVPSTQPPEPIDPVVALMDTMSDEELVGQLFLARYPGPDAAIQAVESYHIGSFILFSKDFAENTPEMIAAELGDLQARSRLPLLIATDEEGGTVTRVSRYSQYRSSKFPSPRSLYNQGGLPLVLQNEEEKCRLLLQVGVNVNMAPVCDVTTNKDAFMYSRALGQNAETTGQYVSSVVQTMSTEGVGSVLKHFPGYGNNTDTHIGTAVDSRPLDSLEQTDLVPFQAGIKAGCDAILVSHTIVACLDESTPASLSPAAVGYLRQSMGFEGVIVTDDLVMEAITDVYGVGESAVLAVLAGNDLLCCSDYAEQYRAVLTAVQEGRITLERLRESVERILRWKIELGLLELPE